MSKIARTGILLIGILTIKSLANASTADTLRLYYSIGVYKLSEVNRKQLALISDSAESGSKIHVIGLADYLGTKPFNQTLSDKRADEVKKYLSSLNSIYHIIAKGEGQILSSQSHTRVGDSANRRVDVIFIKKERGASKSTTSAKNPRFQAKLDSLSSAKIGNSIDFDELIFNPGSHHLLLKSIPLLEQLTKYLTFHKNIVFEIRGHICCDYEHADGPDLETSTQNLSVNRAKEIYDYLLANGISSERMTYKGVGSSKPKIYPEVSEEDRTANRRVEIIIINK